MTARSVAKRASSKGEAKQNIAKAFYWTSFLLLAISQRRMIWKFCFFFQNQMTPAASWTVNCTASIPRLLHAQEVIHCTVIVPWVGWLAVWTSARPSRVAPLEQRFRKKKTRLNQGEVAVLVKDDIVSRLKVLINDTYKIAYYRIVFPDCLSRFRTDGGRKVNIGFCLIP